MIRENIEFDSKEDVLVFSYFVKNHSIRRKKISCSTIIESVLCPVRDDLSMIDLTPVPTNNLLLFLLGIIKHVLVMSALKKLLHL
jgi:hypothetical protein